MNKVVKKKSAFTLIEMAIVLFIISLLMLLILPNLNTQRKNAVSTHATAMVDTIQNEIDLYENAFPNDAEVTFDDLKSNGYLTASQLSKAQDLGITIANNTATR